LPNSQHNLTGLSAVFTNNAVADYSSPVGVLHGLPTIISSLTLALINFTTQQSLTTQTVDIVSNGQAEMYLIAVHFGVNNSIYEGMYAWA
jgi:hypothetical protein